jgi:hypothetical protein
MMLANGLANSPRSTIRTEDEILLLNGMSGKSALSSRPSCRFRPSSCGGEKGSALLGFDPLLNEPHQGKEERFPRPASFEDLGHVPREPGPSSRTSRTLQQNNRRAEKASAMTENQGNHSLIREKKKSVILKVNQSVEKRSGRTTLKGHRRSHSDGQCMNWASSLICPSDLVKGFEDNDVSNASSLGNPISLQRVKSLTPSRLLRSRSATNKSTTAAGKLITSECTLQHSQLANKLNPTSFLSNNDSLILRTSEQDPALHQLELPKAAEMLSDMKICALLDMYHSIDNNFDFALLTRIPNFSLKEYVSLGKTSLEARGLEAKHKPIIQQLLDNGEGITVEGYASENAEVAIFEVPSRSKIVVVFRGNDEEQAKPVRKTKLSKNKGKPDQQNLEIFPAFEQAYFELESKFSAVVDKLTDENPFAQVVFCGHSFGGALATIASVRYASNRPTMRVSAHVFGCPKVGAVSFRQLANSLSNLRVIRFENRNDPVVDTPVDNGKWHHVGHSILVSKDNSVTAYRFDRNKPLPTVNNIFRKNSERNSTAYCQALENCVFKKQWIECFSGEDVGDGVKGKDDENRHMV